MILEGRVHPGMGRAAEFFDPPLLDRLEAALGWRPRPGTLNVMCVADAPWDRLLTIVFDGEVSIVRGTTIPAKAPYPIKSALYRLRATTQPRRLLEIVAPISFRELLAIEVGDTIRFDPEFLIP